MAPVWEIAKELGKTPIAKFTDCISLDQKVSVLNSKMEELRSQMHDLQKKLSTAEKLGKERKREVELWLKNVQKLSDEVCNINNGLGESRWLSVSRIYLRNRVEKAFEEVTSLQEKCKSFDELVLNLLPTVNISMQPTEIVGETTSKTSEKIWECLMDPEVGCIGIYGMGGVGKTIIMKHINDRLIERKSFENVIWVPMSNAVNLQLVQCAIADAIGLDLANDNSGFYRSRKIITALKSMKRFVLILDEVWEAFPLDDIGIPKVKLNSANGCKLLFTTRDLKVCHILESQEQIKVDVLSEDEAWQLFKNKIGGDTVLSPDVHVIAKDVAFECGRLPFAIVTVGQDLRRQSDVRVWSNTLNKLRRMKKIKYMEEHILPRLKSSYDHFRNEEYRDHFLYCALYPRHHHIPNREIIEHWVWDGLIEEEDNKKDEINEGQTILNELKDACMLENGPSEFNVECVMMHNLIRHMAIGITRTTQQFMVKAGVGLQELPSEEELAEDVVRISLMRNNIEALPHGYKCSKLSTLLLQNNKSLRNISPSFFMHLRCLRVLNLSHTMIESLPKSISALVNLHALLLGSCLKLNTLPPLRNLKKLRVLDISLTAIDELPQGLEELVKLRHLDLSWTCKLRVIQSGLMSNLSNLEDLEMYGSGWRWSSNSVEMRRFIEEVTNLRRLRNLSLHFRNLASLTDYVNSQNRIRLENVALAVGPTSKIYPRLWGFSVEMAGCDLIDQETSLVIPDSTQRLRIRECHRLARLSQLHCLSNLEELKEYEIYKCHGLVCILTTEENALPSIEKLDLRELPHLRVLYDGVVPHGALANLRFLYIKACHCLTNLFSRGLLPQLAKIEEVRVEDCRCLIEIVEKEERDEENIANRNTRRRMTVTFPSLKLLTLVDLPKLESISGEPVSSTSVTYLVIKNCPKLKKLPFNDLSFNLKGEIKGSRVWWDALEWDGFNDHQTLLQSLFEEDSA